MCLDEHSNFSNALAKPELEFMNFAPDSSARYSREK